MISHAYVHVEAEKRDSVRELLDAAVPMWIFDRTTLEILEVNEAATDMYGYSREEFLRMTILDIRPSEDIPRVLQIALRAPGREANAGVWTHRRKDGTVFSAKVLSWEITFEGREAALVLARAALSTSASN